MCFECGFYISDLTWVMPNLIIMAQDKYDHLGLVLHLIVDLLNGHVQLLN
jgi:hypothetical protein